MKKLIAILLVVVLTTTGSLVALASSTGVGTAPNADAATQGESELRYSVDEVYIVIIPADIAVTDAGNMITQVTAAYQISALDTIEVRVVDGIDAGNTQLNAGFGNAVVEKQTVNGDIILENEENNAFAMTTQLYRLSNDTTVTTTNNIVARFCGTEGIGIAGTPFADTARVIHTRGVQAQANLLPAGDYVGNVTFSISIETTAGLAPHN